jgi:hypothetical protein
MSRTAHAIIWLESGHFGDRIDDVGIRSATTDVAAHALAQFGSRHPRRRGQVGARMARDIGLDLIEHGHRGADLPRRAIAALIAVMLDESGLHRVQAPGPAQALDGGDPRVLVHDGQREAGNDPPPVHEHRARAALPLIAALFGAGEAQVLAQRVEQSRASVELEHVRPAVHVERDLCSR